MRPYPEKVKQSFGVGSISQEWKMEKAVSQGVRVLVQLDNGSKFYINFGVGAWDKAVEFVSTFNSNDNSGSASVWLNTTSIVE
jgi:hypothetical protein